MLIGWSAEEGVVVTGMRLSGWVQSDATGLAVYI